MEAQKENKLDVRKAYEAIGRIIGYRYGVEVTLTKIRKRDVNTRKETA